jgi:hypothetical protein
MGKLIVGVAQILPLCVVLLLFPAFAVAQLAAPSELGIYTRNDGYGLWRPPIHPAQPHPLRSGAAEQTAIGGDP